jgi:hypothetical protein
MGHLNVNQTMDLQIRIEMKRVDYTAGRKRDSTIAGPKVTPLAATRRADSLNNESNLQRTAGLRSTTWFRFHFSMLPRTRH